MNECPACHRRLLSHASVCCSWCGAVIEDAAYQADAQAKREAFHAHAAAHDAQSLEKIAAISNAMNPLGMTPIYGPSTWTQQEQSDHLRLIDAQRVEAQEKERFAAIAARSQTHGKQSMPKQYPDNEQIKDETQQAEDRFQHLELSDERDA